MRIEVWGALRVVPGLGPVLGPRDFPGVKPKQLLEILVADRGHAVSKSRLADLLWGEALPQNYLATLETYVSVLRQTLEPGVRARDSIIMTERGGYRLDAERTSLDIEEFDALVASATGVQPVPALAAFSAALALVRGDVFEDEPYSQWAEQLRSTYRHRQVKALISAGRLALISGEAAAALASAEQAVALDPLAESAYRVLMASSYALWRQEDALRAFDRCRTLLAEELGVDPMDETVALHLSILRHEDVASLMPQSTGADAGPSVVDQSRPVPATAAPRSPTGGLLGRVDELAQLEAAVAHAFEGHFTTLMLVGDSGIGKTRLAEELAARVGAPVGVNRCSDLERELPYVALSLALRPLVQDHQDAPMPVVVELLRRADLAQPFDHFARLRVMESLATVMEQHSPFLLVLDDTQWADAETLATLGYLRRRCPTAPVVVLLTCPRVALRRDGLDKIAVDLRLDLGELSVDDISGLGAGVYDATDGYPLFVTDWVEARRRGLSESFTPALRERVVTRCWDLGPQAYRLLTVASLLDAPFSPALLCELVGASDDVVEDLERLVDEQLLVSVGDQFCLRHALVRRILAETFSAGRRARLLARAKLLTDQPARRRRSSDAATALAEQLPPLQRRSGDTNAAAGPAASDIEGPGDGSHKPFLLLGDPEAAPSPVRPD